ncbi:unnamed protein product [Haemonchus placei]|uniref:DDE_Tnp_1_7 domain-containing protein n=1 Tax=Haemonchus placei TaxID=6290 RepID=A0A0N4X2T2_HAEPC|nr:unnamed protein product [Haemonchus placei]
MEALENSFVQLLVDSDEEADNEDVSAAPDGLLADAVESSDDVDSEGESDAGWSSTIVQPNVVPFTEDSGNQNDDVYAFSNPMSFYKLFMTDDLVKLVIEESNRYGSAKYSTWSVLEEQGIQIEDHRVDIGWTDFHTSNNEASAADSPGT